MEDLALPVGFSPDAKTACWGCGAVISSGDNYCKICGKGQGPHVPWQYKHWGVIITALCLGPLALYFVWRSPVISRNAKAVYTAIIGVLTWIVIKTFYGVWNYFQTMFGAVQGLSVY
jgi:hypothetical protein